MNFAGVPTTLLLSALEKAVTTGTITSIVPEDLEIEAHNTLWDESDETELTLLKLAPSVEAKQIKHEFARITKYGNTRGSKWFTETSLPPESNFESDRVVVNIRIMGEIGPTYLLASLEQTVQALGTSGAQNIERVALMKSVLRTKNINCYFSDTSTSRTGSGGPRAAGIAQQIREGTDGTTGTSPFGSHAFDMKGQPLNVDTVREHVAESAVLYGAINCMIMDPFSRADYEGSMDPALRLPMPISASPYMIGQQIAGIQTQGGIVRFFTDNSLSALYSRPQYTTAVETGAPTTVPALSDPPVFGALAGSETSDWDAATVALGDVFYVVTEKVNEIEGLGVRTPASGGVTPVAGDKCTFTATPGNSLADSFVVYRGIGSAATTTAWMILEVKNDGLGGAVTISDFNHHRPNTGVAFGLRIVSESQRALFAKAPDAYEAARGRSSDFLKRTDRPGNTIAIAELGPRMGILQLANVLPTVERPLVYSALAPEVRNPFQNFYFYNIGRSS